ncbi:hypothetical protein DITRI_Ditri18aG0048900 [Diplodiscus trichospermus]
MVPGKKECDVDFIKGVFDDRNIDAILNVPLLSTVEDTYVWHYTTNGCYTVKSGYHIALNLITNATALSLPGRWPKLWNLQMPAKAKKFLWRLCRGCLPTKEALRLRGVQVPLTCSMCSCNIEDLWHLFYACPFAKACFKEANILNLVDSQAHISNNMAELVFNVWEHGNESDCKKFGVILHGIWKSRNDKIWGSEHISAEATVRDFEIWVFLFYLVVMNGEGGGFGKDDGDVGELLRMELNDSGGEV